MERTITVKQNGAGITRQGPFKVLVDPAKSLEQMLAEGGYQSLSPRITPKNFPTQEQERKEVELWLFRFSTLNASPDTEQIIDTGEILKEFSSLGYYAAGIKTFLSFGAEYRGGSPFVAPIIGLGSFITDEQDKQKLWYPCFPTPQRFSVITLARPGASWPSNYWFLAVAAKKD